MCARYIPMHVCVGLVLGTCPGYLSQLVEITLSTGLVAMGDLIKEVCSIPWGIL